MPDEETGQEVVGGGPFGTGTPPPLASEEPAVVDEPETEPGTVAKPAATPEAVTVSKEDWEGLQGELGRMSQMVRDTHADWQRMKAEAARAEEQNRKWQEYLAYQQRMAEAARDYQVPAPENPDSLLEDGNAIVNFGQNLSEATYRRAINAVQPAVQALTEVQRQVLAMRPVVVDNVLSAAEREWESAGYHPETFSKLRGRLREVALSTDQPTNYDQFVQPGAAMLWAQHMANHEKLPLMVTTPKEKRTTTPTAPSVPRSTQGAQFGRQERADAARVAAAFDLDPQAIEDGFKKRRDSALR